MKKISALMLGFALLLGSATTVFADDDKHEGKKDEHKKHLTFSNFDDDKHEKKDEQKKH